MPERPFRVGATRRRITPPHEVGPVYRAGYKMMEAERLTGTVDEIFLRCMTVENEATRVVFLSLDLIGLFRDFTDALAARLAPLGIEPSSLIVATTHSHASPDTMGAWGPSFGITGCTLSCRLIGAIPWAPRMRRASKMSCWNPR